MAVLTIYIPRPRFDNLGGKGPLDTSHCAECLAGSPVVNPDGSCGCTTVPVTQPVKYPPQWPQTPYGWSYWGGSGPLTFGNYPAPVPNYSAPVPTTTKAAPAAPAADNDLWFGLEPWKVVLGAAALGGGIYLATQGAPGAK